jgi:hypothetical protein
MKRASALIVYQYQDVEIVILYQYARLVKMVFILMVRLALSVRKVVKNVKMKTRVLNIHVTSITADSVRNPILVTVIDVKAVMAK